ncbi:MAG: Gfo/Idh/MocA family oxidoreductase [Arenicellales bacterium]|nr:Gfo/Idh/MocA family oxidoreductase [Arenicellales bacterium]
MPKRDIKVGVIGAGTNTKKMHIPNLQAIKGVQVVSVANRSRASGEKVAKAFSIPNVADSWEDIIYEDDVDAICIGTWPNMHAPLTIAALESGKHVLCEARMAMNSLEAQAMFEASRTHPNLVAQVVPAPLTLEYDQTISGLIADGYIGELITVDARIAGSHFPDWDSTLSWRQDRDLSGNNIMFMGIWYECMMRWVGTAKTVQAIGQNVVRHRLREDGRRVAMTIPDHIDVLCTMEQGGQMRLTVSAVVGHLPGVDIYICGTEGTIRLHDTNGVLSLQAGQRRHKKLSTVKIPKSKRGKWRVEEEFINAINGREHITHTDFATGVKYMEWTDAVTKAMRTGKTVHLPLEIDY